jgi:hypothetical protein
MSETHLIIAEERDMSLLFFLNRVHAAQAFDMDKRTFNKWIRSKVRHAPIGGSEYYLAKDLYEFWLSQAQSPNQNGSDFADKLRSLAHNQRVGRKLRGISHRKGGYQEP